VLKGRRGHARLVILTVVDDEFDAVQDELNATVELGVSGIYGPIAVQDQYCPFVLAQCPSRSNMPAMSAAQKLLEAFQPEALILVGVAGGVQRKSGETWSGPTVGDVVVADYVHYADFTKNVEGEELMRYYPVDQPTSSMYSSHVNAIRRSEWWTGMQVDRPGDGAPRLSVANVLAVEGLAGDPSNERQQKLLKRFDHAAAVGMESYGVAKAMHEGRTEVHYNPSWMCIRGISDPVHATPPDEPVDNDAIRSTWRRYAAAAAARVTHRVVARVLSEARGAGGEDPGRPAFVTGEG
jgi:nucleoside phosphorylase